MKSQPFEKVIPTCPVCGKGMPEGFIVQFKKERSSLEPAVPVEEANDVALKQFPNGMAQDSLFDMLQEARREGFIYGANWKEENKRMPEGFIPQIKKDAGVINADLLQCQIRLEQEQFNHTNTRIAWDRTCEERDKLKAIVSKEAISSDNLHEAAFKYAKSLYKFAEDKDIKESSQYEAFIAGTKFYIQNKKNLQKGWSSAMDFESGEDDG